MLRPRLAKIAQYALLGAVLGTPFGAFAAPLTGKHADAAGRTQLIIGQTTDGITDYVVHSKMPAPYGVTLYAAPTLISGGFTTPSGEVSKLAEWYGMQYGPQDLGALTALPQLKNTALSVGYYLASGFAYDIANGKNRSKMNEGNALWENTKHLITDLKNTGRPVFLRVGYEAEAPWNTYDPAAYQKIWAMISAEIKAQKADNIATVWQLAAFCPASDYWGAGIKARQLVANLQDEWGDNTVVNVNEDKLAAGYDAWYPASADWTGLSIFDPQNCAGGYKTVQKVVDYLASKGKPIMVAEATARGYDYNPATGLYRYAQLGEPARNNLKPEAVWDAWYAPFFKFIRANQDKIRAVAYISDDWERYSHWACQANDRGDKEKGCAEANWGNARVEVNPVIREKWRNELSADGQFLKP